ncbi:MAG: amidohydrolase family protein, partial [Candidatus Latescibacterota bacterium]
LAAQALVDPMAPDAADQLEHLATEQGFGGIRIHLSRYGDPANLAAPNQNALWERARDLNLAFNLFGKGEDHAPIEPIIARYPEVKVVVDHIGGTVVNEPAPNPILTNLLNWAKYPNVYVKISNIHTRSKEPYPFKDTHAIIKQVYDTYGPQRLMWGTDFPHILKTTGYQESLNLIRNELSFTPEDLEWLLCKTILKVWSFKE